MSEPDLTREQILAMPAGQAMDALIARLVLGISARIAPARVHDSAGNFLHDSGELYVWPSDGEPEELPAYSTDIAAAWQVVEKLDLFGVRDYVLYRSTQPGGEWCVSLVEPEPYDPDTWHHIANAPTAPLVICRVSLLTTLPVTPSPS